jgi:hypothetical protein
MQTEVELMTGRTVAAEARREMMVRRRRLRGAA